MPDYTMIRRWKHSTCFALVTIGVGIIVFFEPLTRLAFADGDTTTAPSNAVADAHRMLTAEQLKTLVDLLVCAIDRKVDVKQRVEAVAAIRKQAHVAAREPLVRIVIDKHDDKTIREAALEAACAIPERQNVTMLIELLRDAGLRRAANRILTDLAGGHAPHFILFDRDDLTDGEVHGAVKAWEGWWQEQNKESFVPIWPPASQPCTDETTRATTRPSGGGKSAM